jgi:hypothetical protein
LNREKVTDFFYKKIVGSKKEVARAWKISIKKQKFRYRIATTSLLLKIA